MKKFLLAIALIVIPATVFAAAYPVSQGGTGVSTFGTGGIIYSHGGTKYLRHLATTTSTVLTTNASGDLAWTATSSLGLPTFTTLLSYLSLSDWYATTTDGLDQGTTNLYNQTHTGDATGATALTIADNAVDGTDISLSSEAQGDVMYFNGTDWVRLAVGSPGQVLEVNAGGTAPEWDTDDSGGAGATPGGSDTHVQYNTNSAFGGDAGFTYASSTDTLSVVSEVRSGIFTGTSTTATSTFPRLSVTSSISILGEYMTNFTNYVRGLFTGGDGIDITAGDIDFACAEVASTGLSCTGSNISLDNTGDWTGTLDGNDIPGGAVALGDLLYGSAAGAISPLTIGSTGDILTVSGGLPAWAATSSIGLENLLTFGDGLTRTGDAVDFTCTEVEGTGINCSTNDITLDATGDWTGTVDGNNFAGGAIAAGDLLYGASAGSITELGIAASGTVLTSNGVTPHWMATSSLGISTGGGSSQWTDAGLLLYPNEPLDRVAIGTSTVDDPEAMLTITATTTGWTTFITGFTSLGATAFTVDTDGDAALNGISAQLSFGSPTTNDQASIGINDGGSVGLTSPDVNHYAYLIADDTSARLDLTDSAGGLVYLSTNADSYISTTHEFGVGTTSPWGKFSVSGLANSDYLRPVFTVSTSTSAEGQLFHVFATTTPGNITGSLVSTLRNGALVVVGKIVDSVENLFVNGPYSSSWSHTFCDGFDIGANITADTARVCDGVMFDEVTAATLAAATTLGNTIDLYGARLTVTSGTTNDAGGLYTGSLVRTMFLATTTPSMEVVIGGLTTVSSTTSFFIGFQNQPSGSENNVPTGGCYIAATSTSNWVAVFDAASDTVQDTGVATSTSYQRWRISATDTKCRVWASTDVNTALSLKNDITGTYQVVNLFPSIIVRRVINGSAVAPLIDVYSIRFWKGLLTQRLQF